MIVYDDSCRVFTLHTRSTAYQMKADRYGVLLHTYYGPRISGGDLSCLIRYTDRGFSPNPDEVGNDRTYSLDTLPQEYAGGGGRFDAGMLYYTPQIWCSDNTDAVDRLSIQYGTSFAYPPCTMGAHVSAAPNEQTGRNTPLETRGTVALSGTFGYELDLGLLSPAEKKQVVQQIKNYQDCYDLVHQGDYYRLSPPSPDGPPTAWAHVSPDRREALVSVVAGQAHAAPLPAVKAERLRPRFAVPGGRRRTLARRCVDAGGIPSAHARRIPISSDPSERGMRA